MPTCKLTRKTLKRILLHVICLHFVRAHHDYFCPKSLWKCASTISFSKCKRKVVLIVVVYDSSSQLSSCGIWNLHFSYLSNKLEFFVSCNVKIAWTSLYLPCVLINVLSYQNLIVLRHGGNNFLFYFDICIKFTLSTIISMMKKW